MSDGLSDLERELGASPPAALRDLPPETLAALATAVAGARERQARALLASLDAALKQAPRPLRGVLRKALVG